MDLHVVLALPRPLQPVDGTLAGLLTLALAHVHAANRPPGNVLLHDEAVYHRSVLHLVERLAHDRHQLLARAPGVLGKLLGHVLLKEETLGGLVHPRTIIGHGVSHDPNTASQKESDLGFG